VARRHPTRFITEDRVILKIGVANLLGTRDHFQ
jgi:hypothetical protein